jgi:hypothetical protein
LERRFLRNEQKNKIDAKKQKGQTLVDFLRNNPLVGLDLDFSRLQDYPRDVDFGDFADEPGRSEAKEPNKNLKQ